MARGAGGKALGAMLGGRRRTRRRRRRRKKRRKTRRTHKRKRRKKRRKSRRGGNQNNFDLMGKYFSNNTYMPKKTQSMRGRAPGDTPPQKLMNEFKNIQTRQKTRKARERTHPRHTAIPLTRRQHPNRNQQWKGKLAGCFLADKKWNSMHWGTRRLRHPLLWWKVRQCQHILKNLE